jgi:pyrimidine-nucleoside phosphorylase
MAVTAQQSGEADDEEIAFLAQTLARSGAMLEPSSDTLVDIASTGGPASLTTLLSPLITRALGGTVSKIGVPGRPAGALDTLGSLAGFDVALEPPKAHEVLVRCGFLHTAAGTHFAPLDRAFFQWRQANGYQASAPLAIASLLSKKIAAGVSRVCLDVRIGAHGNLGTSFEEGRVNASRFIRVAGLLGIEAVCVLTANEGLTQPWVGRGEALVALSLVLRDAVDGPLLAHRDLCGRLASLALGDSTSHYAPTPALWAAARKAHEEMLLHHGCDPTEFWRRVAIVEAAPRRIVEAPTSGYLLIDVATIRERLVTVQALGRRRLQGAPAFPDPCGVTLNKQHGASVTAGEGDCCTSG